VDANLYRLFTVFVLFFISISGLPLEIRLSSGEGRDAINWYFLLNQDLNFLHHVTRGLFVFHDLR
jgi:multisubunit Na+/H+ antiporter MnhB subunit